MASKQAPAPAPAKAPAPATPAPAPAPKGVPLYSAQYFYLCGLGNLFYLFN